VEILDHWCGRKELSCVNVFLITRIGGNVFVNCSHHNNETSMWDMQSWGGGGIHLSSYVGVTLQSFMFQSLGQFKTHNPGLENAGCQNAWDTDLTSSW
jgi:hypothetical protein